MSPLSHGIGFGFSTLRGVGAPAGPSLSQSTVAAGPGSVPADGASTSTITVTLKTAGGANYGASGGTVVLTVDNGTLGAVTDNNNGTYTATYTAPASSAASAIVSATLGGLALSNTATLTLSAGELAYLSSRLSGGSAGIAFLYTRLSSVTSSGGMVDAISDLKGAAPDLVGVTTTRPAWDAVNKLVTGDAIDDRLSWAANNTLADFNTLKCLASVGVAPTAAKGRIAGIADSLSFTRYMLSLANTTITAAWPPGQADSGVAISANRRLVIMTQSVSTGTVAVPSQAAASRAITGNAGGTGSNRLTLLDDFPAQGANSAGPWCSSVGLTYLPTVGDVAVLLAWAQAYHAAVAA
jgi:adhesin/invasin